MSLVVQTLVVCLRQNIMRGKEREVLQVNVRRSNKHRAEEAAQHSLCFLIIIIFLSLFCGTVNSPRQCNAESKQIPEQQRTTEPSEEHDTASQLRTSRCSYPWWC